MIDQFEELFTLADPGERDLVLDALVHAIDQTGSNLRVVITLRADFYDRPLRHSDFGALLQDNTVHVLPMSGEQLEEAITAPAAIHGVTFAVAVVDAIRAEVASQPGRLPLLQYTLTELFEQRRSDRIDLDEYRRSGGVTGSLAGRAEELYAGLSNAGKDATHRLFMRLVTTGEGVEDTRRRTRRTELAAVDDAVIDLFGRHRLLSFDRDPITRAPTVEVAHEALIREWPRLKSWIDADRDGIRLLRHLQQAATSWRAAGEDPDELYRGGRLDAAVEWVETHADHLEPTEEQFVTASLQLRSDEELQIADRAMARERQNIRLRRVATGAAVLAVLALLAGGVALVQRRAASQRADEAALAQAESETRRLIAEAAKLAPTNHRIALLMAAEAYRRDPGPASLGALKTALTAQNGLLGYLGDSAFDDVGWTGDGRVVGVTADGVVVMSTVGEIELDIAVPRARLLAVDHRSNRLAVADGEGVRLFDLRTGGELGVQAHESLVTAMTFNSAGELATGDASGVIRLFDVDGRIRAEFMAHPERHDDISNLSIDGGLPTGVRPPLPHAPRSFTLGVKDLGFS